MPEEEARQVADLAKGYSSTEDEAGFWERYHRGIVSEEKGWWEAEYSPEVEATPPEEADSSEKTANTDDDDDSPMSYVIRGFLFVLVVLWVYVRPY